VTPRAGKQVLAEQIAVCEGVIDRLKAEDPTPALVLSAARDVLAVLESKLAELEAPAADQDP
jgi:hypothetical protein